MGNQPISKRILSKHPEVNIEKKTYTLLIDGDSLLQLAWNADTKVNTKGEHYGGVFQFLLQIKMLISKREFDFVYVAFDIGVSGQLRANILPTYKSNRDKTFSTSEVHSDYYDQMDAFIKKTLEYSRKNKEKIQAKLTSKEDFHRQKDILRSYLQELFIRELSFDTIEGDDILAYFCLNKKESDLIYLVSGDYDLLQMISPTICQYIPRLKKFVSINNFKEVFDYDYRNVLSKKILCGDSSDFIHGIKGITEDGLFKMMPEMKERKVEVWEIIERAKELNQKRIDEKKKPYEKYLNIVNGVTLGMQKNLYEINEKIINLKKPLLTDEAKSEIKEMMYSPLEPSDRSLSNLYKLMLRDGIDELIDSSKFSNFFSTFAPLREREIKFYEKWIKENS